MAADKKAFIAKEVWDLFVGFEQTHGMVVQVEPIQPMYKAPGTMLLN